MRLYGTTICTAKHSAEINAMQEREIMLRKAMHEKKPVKIIGKVNR